ALAAGSHAKVRYEGTVRQPRELALDAVVSFSPVAESAIVYRDGAEFTRYSWLDREGIPIPPARPGAEIRLVAWSSERGDSATMGVVVWPSEYRDAASVRRLAGRRELLVRAPVHNPIMPAVVTDWVPALRGARPVPDSMAAAAPREHSAAGAPAPSAPAAVAETVFVAPARLAAQRAAERAASVSRGPGIEIFTPLDGAVLAVDRVYIGVKGEPNVPLVLYDGVKPIDTVRTRIDGVFDFIAVPLAPGPHRLRVAMKSSWGQERWDSIAVHVTGLPARFEAPSRVTLVADGRSAAVVDVR